jgi:hypothetical protein
MSAAQRGTGNLQFDCSAETLCDSEDLGGEEHWMRRHWRRLGILALCVLGGCASVPPEAASHAGHLETYHEKTAQGTLAAFDAAVAAHDFAVDKIGGQMEVLWRAYIEDSRSAREDFATAHNQLALAASRLNQTTWGESSEEAKRILANVQEAMQVCEAAATRFGKYADDASAEMSKDVQAFANLRHAARTNSAELRALIEEHNKAVGDGIRLHRELFDSYNMVAINRSRFLGGKLEEQAQQVQDKASGLLDKVRARSGAFADALKTLLDHK